MEHDRKQEESEVGALEDLMREHGVLRRALLVYRQSAAEMRSGGSQLDPAALNRTARLFRSFGEDYHERKLEETYIFPVIRKISGSVAGYPDILVAQHERGRAITDHILDVTATGRPGAADVEPLSRAMEAFVLMYENHAAREDTVVFPAWKKALSTQELHELSEKFEEIEHEQFGEDGFDDVVRQISEIERLLGFEELAQFTAPPPPKR